MTTRRVFFSFHYKPDNWRASEVRNIGKVEGNSPASDNDWETVTEGGEVAIKKWINDPDERQKLRSGSCRRKDGGQKVDQIRDRESVERW